MYILASQSPRREELLKKAGLSFLTVPSFFDEEQVLYTSISAYVETLALEKAKSVLGKFPHHVVIGADTVVYLENKVLGKPKDEQDAFLMLKSLSGKTHEVYTGLAVITSKEVKITHDVALVTFKHLLDEDINAYIQTKEPFDKSGSYAIQGLAKVFISHVQGDVETVIGLPTKKVLELIKEVSL